MSTKSSNKSPSPSSVSGSCAAGFLQLSLDFSGSYPDSFTIDSSLLSESPLAHSTLCVRTDEGLPRLGSPSAWPAGAESAERTELPRGRGSGAVTFICIGRGSGYRRYISSDGYPWTLWLKGLRLERARIDAHNSPVEIFHNGAKRQPYCRMSLGGKWHLVHRVVAQYFLNGGQPIPHGLQVDHLDSDHFNNSVSNLEIVTREENQRRCNAKHGWKHMTEHRRKLAKAKRHRRFARFHALRATQASQSTTQQSTTASVARDSTGGTDPQNVS